MRPRGGQKGGVVSIGGAPGEAGGAGKGQTTRTSVPRQGCGLQPKSRGKAMEDCGRSPGESNMHSG